MISVSGKKWIEKKINKNAIDKIKQDFQFSEVISKLIVSRNFDLNEIYSIKKTPKIVNEFKNNKDFITASSVLENCINKKEFICIFGDYDVDGIVSTSLLAKFFDYIKQPYFFYIPDREKDGYGPSKLLFEKLILKKPKLVIMVDCGSTSNDAINFLNSKKIKSLIIDHHEINKPYPKSNATINPKKNSLFIYRDYYCATTLTYFFLDILTKKVKSSFNLSNYLIYIVLSLVCDVMPLRKINRIIALNSLKNFNIKDNLIFKTLYELGKKNTNINIDDLGYFIGPIINSGGRLSNSNLAAKLLISENKNIIENSCIKLIELNNKRKEIENKILNDINFEKISKENKDVIIYYSPNINEGIIGIIASRLKDYFNKPAIVITNSNRFLKGSARSTTNYNIGKVIKKLIDYRLIESGGGHNMAAGFTLKNDNLNNLKDFILRDFKYKNKNLTFNSIYDAEISLSAIKNELVQEINQLKPFGYENPQPIFLIKDLKILKIKILKNKHISLILKPKIGRSIQSICFNCLNTSVGNHLISYKQNIHVIGLIQENNWNNKKILQLNIKDILI